jgi:hypothetical protein
MTQTNVEGFSLLQHSEECHLSNFLCSSAMLIHNETLAARLASSDMRLPPNYVGVRKVRPGIANKTSRQMMVCTISSDAPPRELQESRSATTTTTTNQPEAPSHTKHHEAIRPATSGVVVFKTLGDDSKERRMTKQEKKKETSTGTGRKGNQETNQTRTATTTEISSKTWGALSEGARPTTETKASGRY